MGRRNYTKPTLACNVAGFVNEEQKLFCLLHAICGYQAARSYQIAFRTKATLSSCSSLASRLLAEDRIQYHINQLALYHENHALIFNEKAIKGNYW